MYTKIANVQIRAAINAHCNAFSHNEGLTLSSCIKTKLAGIAQLFRLSTNSFAVVAVNDPSIWAVHPHIFVWITGLVINSHHTKMAIWVPTFSDVISQNTSLPLSSKLIATTGSHICHWLTAAYLKYAQFNISQLLVFAVTRSILSCTEANSIS